MEELPKNSALSLVVSAGCQICGPEASLYPQLETSAQKLYAGMSKHRKQGHKSFRKSTNKKSRRNLTDAQTEMEVSQKSRPIVPAKKKMKDICYSEVD